MADMNKIMAALGGFGAGYQGQGAQYLQGIQNQKILDQNQQDREQQLDEKRKAAMVQDAWTVNQLLDQGKAPVALKLLDNRIEHINKLKGDPSDTIAIKEALVSGDPARVAQAKQELQTFSEAGIAAGAWAPPQRPEDTWEGKKFAAEQGVRERDISLKERAQTWKEQHPNESNANNPYYQFIPTSEGLAVGDARTGNVRLAQGSGGGNLMPIAADVGLKERMAGAGTTGEGEAKQVLDAKTAEKRVQQLNAGIKQAKDLIPKATASGIGALRDMAGRTIGVTTDAAKAAARLDTLSGWMVANVPRMEGPQSNIDVENYKTMAAKVGDRSAPQEERLAALDQLEQLQSKYSDINKSTISGGQSKAKATTEKTVNWNDL